MTNGYNNNLRNGSVVAFNCNLSTPLFVKKGQNISYMMGCDNLNTGFTTNCLGGTNIQKTAGVVLIEGTNVNWTGNSQAIDGGSVTTYTSYLAGIVAIYTEQALSITLNTPSSNAIVLANVSVVFNATLDTSNTLQNASLIIDGIVNETINVSGQTNYSIFTKSFSSDSYGNHTWLIMSCDGGTIGCQNSSTYNFNVSRYYINAEYYNPMTSSGASELFNINISISNDYIIDSAYLYYNNTQYFPSINIDVPHLTTFDASNTSGKIQMYKTITVPYVNTLTSKNFYWTIYLSNSTGTYGFNISSHSQTINPLSIDNCGTNTFRLFNLTLQDEDTLSTINGTLFNSTIDVSIDLYSSSSPSIFILSYANSFYNVSNVSLCINATLINLTQYKMNTQIRYTANGYAIEYYNIKDYILNSSTGNINISLLDLISTKATSFLITYKDSNYIPVDDALVVIQRKYVGLNQFKTTEIPLTDINGQASASFDKNGVIYSISFVKGGVVLASFNNVAVACADYLVGQCYIVLTASSTVPSFPDFSNNIDGVNFNLDFNQNTRTVSSSFFVIDGIPSTMTMTTYLFDSFGNTTICNNTQTSSSGTFTCNIPSSYGNTTIVSFLYKNSYKIASRTFTIFTNPIDNFGYDGIVMVILLMLTIPMMFISSVVGIVIGVVLALIIGSIMAFYKGASLFTMGSIIMWALICGGIIIWKITRKTGGGE